jgi:transcriptional regulator with XRE-family HTH domain
MDDQRFGTAVRAVRLRLGWRQRDVADRAGVSTSVISRLERGHVSTLTLATIRRVSACLDMGADLAPRWRGGELDRVLASGHAALADAVVADLSTRGWLVRPEVTFSIWGERGSIDLLAYHPARRALLVVELKTDLVDPHGLIAQVDRYRRLAGRIAVSAGWPARVIGAWVIVEESTRNRRRLASHAALLRAAFPAAGRPMAAWLRDPGVTIDALSFRPAPNPRAAARRRVRLRASSTGAPTGAPARAPTGAPTT